LRHPDTLFRPVDRLRLIDIIIRGDPLVGNCGISTCFPSLHNLRPTDCWIFVKGVDRLITKEKHSLHAYFALHEYEPYGTDIQIITPPYIHTLIYFRL
jgi:hypothetical protein